MMGMKFFSIRNHNFQWKLHPDRIAFILVIFDLGFCKRRAFHNRPHDRLGAAVKLAGFGEFHQLVGDDRLSLIGHGEIGVLEIARNTEALELLRLHTNPMGREITAFLAELVDRHFVLVLAPGAILFLDLPFDRQAVAVPAGHIIAVIAAHLERAGDDVLEDLVERMADMQIAIGVGRTVMQHIFRLALRALAQALIKAHFVPARDQLRFLLRKAGAHRKFGLRQIERFAPVTP